jgi:hypothetical protein
VGKTHSDPVEPDDRRLPHTLQDIFVDVLHAARLIPEGFSLRKRDLGVRPPAQSNPFGLFYLWTGFGIGCAPNVPSG